MTVYLELTKQFNAGRLRAVLSSGQAVVLHRLAVMSKDGDWILREEKEALDHVLAVLAVHKAKYRFGAPLDTRWMAGGWSAHFEFQEGGLRIRTDFVARPPRVTSADLAAMWSVMEGRDPPFVGVRLLADLKKTNREKDYAVIGELARLLTDPSERLLYSRSARDLIRMTAEDPSLAAALVPERPLLSRIGEGKERLEECLDAERRTLMRENEQRLEAYLTAAQRWSSAWPGVSHRISGMALPEAHRIVVEEARTKLPESVLPKPS
jgi:hypothetical protein